MSRVAYVSGGGTGIGRATATALAGDGWSVVVLGRRPEPLAGTVEAVRAEVPGAELHAVTADLAEPDQVERAVADAAAAAGPRRRRRGQHRRRHLAAADRHAGRGGRRVDRRVAAERAHRGAR